MHEHGTNTLNNNDPQKKKEPICQVLKEMYMCIRLCVCVCVGGGGA
jgi:hypothetical protein